MSANAAPRPQTFDDYIGQERLKRRLEMAMMSALSRGKPLPSTLLLGPPGIGKTSLAYIIANLMGEQIEDHIAASLLNNSSNARLVEIVEEFNGVLFLDEIHGATPKRQEVLLPLLEDGYIVDGSGEKVFSKRLSIVAATTEGDKVIRPLYDRFMIRPPFEPYSDDELRRIVKQMAGFEGMVVEDEWALEVGRASLGLPRYARSLVEVARDILTVTDTMPDPAEVKREAHVTETGLTREHIRYLEILKMNQGKAGIETMRQLIGMPKGHVEFLEIDLIKQGMLARTRTGREITSLGKRTLTEHATGEES